MNKLPNLKSPHFPIYTTLLLTTYYLLLTTPLHAATWSDPSGNNPATFKDLEAVFENILTIFVSLAGIAVFVMFMVGGYQFLFSAGDPQKSAQARSTLTWAIIGLLFLLGAWLILLFIREFTGVDVTTFQIPGTTP